MVLPKIRLSQLLPGAFKSPLKSQTFVQIQGRFHFLLKYFEHPHHWRLCQGRHGLREVQWTTVPLTPDRFRSSKLICPSGSVRGQPGVERCSFRSIEETSSASATWRYKHRKKGQYNKCGRDTVQTKSQLYIWVPNFGPISICSIRELSLHASAKQSKLWLCIILAKW